jgi:tungstate transport system substrate-binding protein
MPLDDTEFPASASCIDSLRLSRRTVLAAASAVALPAFAQSRRADGPLRMGIEGSLQASGLAQRLKDALAHDTGIGVALQPGASAALLGSLERGELDAVITLAPDIEEALTRQGLAYDRVGVASTEWVLVGPAPVKATRKTPASADPAGVAGFTDISSALRQIAAAGEHGEARFIGTAEASGARWMEQSLWKSAGPQAMGPWLQAAPPGAQSVLALAAQTQAYALVERGVWAAEGAGTKLAVLVQGDARQAATYHALRGFRTNHPAGKLVLGWLSGRTGQGVVSAYGRGYRAA